MKVGSSKRCREVSNNVKQCKDCGRLYELNGDNFPLQKYTTRLGKEKRIRWHSMCRTCWNEYEKQRYQRRKEREGVAEKLSKDRNYRYLRLYGLTQEEADTMKQRGCEICGSHDNLNIDHNHKTGKVRGCLCNKCNRGLGYLSDSVENLSKAILYLELNND